MLKAILLAILLLYAIGRYVHYRYATCTQHDEVHYAKTEDGVLLAMYYYRPEKPDKAKLPVICCHGFTENHRIYDIPGRSLCRSLAERGFEVWSIDLRGSPGSVRTASGAPFDWSYDLDDHILLDIPAVLDEACRRSGRKKVHWIGHSMGGMVLYGNLARGADADRIARGVTMSSPGAFSANLGAIRRLAAVEPYLKSLPRLNVIALYTLWWPLAWIGLLRPSMMGNRRNLTGAAYMQTIVNAYADAGMRLAGHFAHCLRVGRFVSRRADAFDYEQNLGEIKTPILALGGEADSLLPPGHVRRVFGQLGSDDKKMIVFGPKNGDREGYGHCDLVVGDRAESEVWPIVAEWLEAE